MFAINNRLTTYHLVGSRDVTRGSGLGWAQQLEGATTMTKTIHRSTWRSFLEIALFGPKNWCDNGRSPFLEMSTFRLGKQVWSWLKTLSQVSKSLSVLLVRAQ